MEVYTYCSYEHARQGHMMGKLRGGQLSAVAKQIPAYVLDFFSMGLFRFLWTSLRPSEDGIFLGVRNLQGEMRDGRKVYCNFAMLFLKDEVELASMVALRMLADWREFEKTFSALFFLGGELGYEMDVACFQEWLAQCTASSQLQSRGSYFGLPAKLLRQENQLSRCTDLHLAVLDATWEEAREALYWQRGRRRPWQALELSIFTKEFINQAPLWRRIKKH